VVATQSENQHTVYLKIVNPESTPIEFHATLDGAFSPTTAQFQVIAPGAENIKNSLDQPDRIKPQRDDATLQGKTLRLTMPAWSAGVVTLKD
jgi:alpha-L-arabinofuranosidase